MHRNLYDTDVTTWSPQGKLHQLDYAMEGVKLGTCGVGLRSNTHVVLAGIRRTLSKLAKHNEKLLKVDSHVGVAFSGITADARYLVSCLRKECFNHRFIYDSPHPIGTLVAKICSQSQKNTQNYSKRPYGVGLLVGGVDESGPRLFETHPSGDNIEYFAVAFGSRCQSAKTYLEKIFKSLPEASPDTLVEHALQALKCSAAQDQELTTRNISVAVVSADEPWRELSEEDLEVALRVVNQISPDQ